MRTKQALVFPQAILTCLYSHHIFKSSLLSNGPPPPTLMPKNNQSAFPKPLKRHFSLKA